MGIPSECFLDECSKAHQEMFEGGYQSLPRTVSETKILEISNDGGNRFDQFGDLRIIVASRQGIKQLGELPDFGKKIT
jgi:hypothetical protein